jgi:hypothetical protein
LNKIISYIIFASSLFISVSAHSEECKPELKALFQEVDHTVQQCVILKNFYKHKNRETLNVLVIDQLKQETANERQALRFSVWVLDKKGSSLVKGLDYPIYQEQVPGRELIDFEFNKSKQKIAIGDFNNDGQINFAFFISMPPRAEFFIKGINTDKQKVESLGHREKRKKTWHQHDSITTGANALIKLEADQIIIDVFDETEVFKLMGTQYEKVL